MEACLSFKVTLFSFLALFTGMILFADSGQNLIRNPSFEDWENKRPAEWKVSTRIQDDGAVSSDETNPHGGGRSVIIDNRKANDSRLYQVVPIEKNTLYRMHCWVRTEDVGMGGKGAYIAIDGNSETSIDVKRTVTDWTRIELFFQNHEDYGTVTVFLGLGVSGSMNTGRAWFDDAILEVADTLPENAIVIDHKRPQPGINTFPGTIVILLVVILIIPAIIVIVLLKNPFSGPKQTSRKKQKSKKASESAYITSLLLGASDTAKKTKKKTRQNRGSRSSR